jgi:DnaJ like chaperone protein
MTWIGKVSAGLLGLLAGGPIAALLAAGMGHNLDREIDGYARAWLSKPAAAERRRRRGVLLTAVFGLGGALARAGRLSHAQCEALIEALAARQGLDAAARAMARSVFADGRQATFPLTAVVNQFRREFHRRPDLVALLLETLLYVEDFGARDEARRRLLADIARRLGFPGPRLAAFEEALAAQRRAGPQARAGMALSEAFATLEVSPGASDDELKRAYRRQLSRHHPDKLAHLDLPPERLAEAAARTDRIRKAYETLRRARLH